MSKRFSPPADSHVLEAPRAQITDDYGSVVEVWSVHRHCIDDYGTEVTVPKAAY